MFTRPAEAEPTPDTADRKILRSPDDVDTGPDPSGRHIPYQPALDGLRGVAVGAVLLFHGGLRWARGGYLGVDTFFVLSGYLITTILLSEHTATGTIGLARFWAHRVRRLFPALCILLLGICAYALFIAAPDSLDQLRLDGLASLFYVANWRFIQSGQGYFDEFLVSPLRHMWSLAIEEQYYLIWPLVVFGLMSWRRSPRVVLVVSIVLAVASAAFMAALFQPGVESSRLYYGTDTHAQSLLIGSALAAAWLGRGAITARFVRWLVIATATAAGAVIFVAFVRLTARDVSVGTGGNPLLYRGGFFVFGLLVAVVILAAMQPGLNPVRSVLAFAPLRWLGVISYGVYLYHWPIYIVLDERRTGLPAQSVSLLALRIGVTLTVAVVSFVFVEYPVRRGAFQRIGAPAYLAPVLLLVMAFIITAATAGARRTTPLASDFTPDKRPAPAAGAVDPDAVRVLLVGDSVAYTLGLGFEGRAASDNRVAVWNQAVLFCELVPGDRRENGEVKPSSDTCRDWEHDWRNSLDIYHPDATLLLIGAWEIFDREINGKWVSFGSPEYDAVLVPILQRAVDTLASQGAPVIVPTTPKFVRSGGDSAQEWSQNDVARSDHFNTLLRALAAANPDTVVLVDLAEFVCPAGSCPDEIEGVHMRSDGVHYRDEDATVVARWLAPQMERIGRVRRDGAPTPPGTSR